ncbi:MAG: glycosyltransferase family 9 protein [Verrucomicrobia bacterium]|nr:glycosyltransferase family 9 protein [Verrucomicrobiota bacterium]
MSNPALRKLLVVRNDNIGDLICSIPAIQLLRKRLPETEIHLLVNSYNAPVVEVLLPQWVDRLLVYRKTKHVGLTARQLIHLAKFYFGLIRERYDAAILLVGGVSRQAQAFAQCSGAPRVIGYGSTNEGPAYQDGCHELEYSWRLAAYLCETNENPPDRIQYPVRVTGARTGVQITSRKPGNRWSAERFAELIRQIHAQTRQKPLLMWSPGDTSTRTHPGDDEKAADILELVPETVEPRPTGTLKDLILTLQECSVLITPDGGAMHLAAAMGSRVVAMFGQSDPVRWRPWTPCAKVLQSPTRSIEDIGVDEVMQAQAQIRT